MLKSVPLLCFSAPSVDSQTVIPEAFIARTLILTAAPVVEILAHGKICRRAPERFYTLWLYMSCV